jgi:hypothetical protein
MDILKHWTPSTFESSTYLKILESRKNTITKKSNTDESGKCTYTYNELGFRGDSISKDGFKVMSIGCSMTEGIGVNDDETWSHVFSQLVGGVNLNFGLGGRSNDYICRALLTYYDLIKPDVVLIMYTRPERKEIYTENNGVEPFMVTHNWGYLKETQKGREIQKLMVELQNDNSDYINWYKNHLLIKYFLESKKCKWIWNGELLNIDYNDSNRFDDGFTHYFDHGSDNTHPGPITHKKYGENLYRYFVNQ